MTISNEIWPLITVLIGIILTAYGYIFKTVNDRIKKLENRPLCKYSEVDIRIENNKTSINRLADWQNKIEPVLTEIRESLSELREAIKWIKEQRDR